MNNNIARIKPSASVQLMAKAKQMKKEDPTIIDLAGGEPDFSTPQRITEATIESLRAGNTHYAVGPGIPPLREAIREKLERENGIRCSADNIMVTPGGKNAIYLAIQAVLKPGEEVIIFKGDQQPAQGFAHRGHRVAHVHQTDEQDTEPHKDRSGVVRAS